MPRDLFGDVTRPFAGMGARSRLTVPLSLCAHAAGVVAIVVVPLVAADALPELRERLSVNVITPVVPPPPPVRRLPPPETPPPDPNAAPAFVPNGIAPEKDPLPVDPSGGSDIGIVTGPIVDARELAPPPPPPPPPPPARAVRVNTSGIAPPARIRDAAPVYPAIAQAARVQGVVIIEATIDTEGAVVDARVLRSVPLLDQAALDAVRQWRYAPSRLNGQPVAVVMTVTVNFQLR